MSKNGSSIKTISRAAVLCLVLSLVYGCTLINPVQPPVFPPTLSPAPVQYTPPVKTAQPTAGVVITPTPRLENTAPPSGGAPARIDFAEGATTYETMGNIPGGSSISFLVSAEQDQFLMVDVGSRNLDVYLEVSGAFDHVVLVDSSVHLTTWQGFLPTTQDYEITLTASGGDSNYDLVVTIPAVIKFSPGAISAAVQGSVTGGQNVHYMLYALAGQTMSVKIHSANNDVLLTLYGIDDGQPLVRSASGATEWSGVLSRSQYFMIITVSSGSPSQYLLDITIR